MKHTARIMLVREKLNRKRTILVAASIAVSVATHPVFANWHPQTAPMEETKVITDTKISLKAEPNVGYSLTGISVVTIAANANYTPFRQCFRELASSRARAVYCICKSGSFWLAREFRDWYFVETGVCLLKEDGNLGRCTPLANSVEEKTGLDSNNDTDKNRN